MAEEVPPKRHCQMVSVIVRARNDQRDIANTLTALQEQELTLPMEILVCDDGSTDRTPEIIGTFPGIRIIPRQDGPYIPGKRLNYLVEQCRGDVVVFNNSDATPQDPHYLAELIAPLLADQADATYGNQLPREDAWWLVKRDSWRAFGDGTAAAKWHFFFSLASAATWRQTLQEEPFDEQIQYSEDVEWASRRKRRLQYVPQARTRHSHNYNCAQLRRRFYGEGYADARIFGKAPPLPRVIMGIAMDVLRDGLFLLKHPQGLPELFFSPYRRFLQRWHFYRGAKTYLKEHPRQ